MFSIPFRKVKIFRFFGKCVRWNTLYQFIGHFPSRVTKLGKFGLNGAHTLLPCLFYPLSSEFPSYHFIINFSIIQRWGAEPTCNLGENREVWACGYIVYNFAISKIYSNVPPTAHAFPTFIIPSPNLNPPPWGGCCPSNCIISPLYASIPSTKWRPHSPEYHWM